jgi:thiol:disulfide interchange protein DsbD
MLPMLPILSSIVFGTTNHHLLSRKRTLLLASLYVAGMAFAFSLAGMATAWFGSGIQASLQSPWVVITFGLLMIVLAGSLLGIYEFHLPAVWHGVVDRWIGKQKGGSAIGAFALGALSSLVASPCVTAPLAGVLTFIAQSGEVRLGGLILFTLACGMGVPLLLFALGASKLVPRAGAWMVRVQRFFGLLMLALAMWVMWPALVSIFTSTELKSQTVKNIAGLEFKVVRTSKNLEQALQEAKNEGKPVLLNFYADWCVSCQELERLTFNDPMIQSKLQNYERIEVDITKSDDDQGRLLKQYKLFGPPGILVIDKNGEEKTAARSVGYISAQKLAPKL